MADKTKLSGFIEFLKERVGFTFDLHNFDHRIKLQKYVYIARKFGWDHYYRYNMYVHGPYSSNLADDYYNLEEIEDNVPLPNMDLEAFKDLVINKDTSWLEVAATLLSLHGSYRRYYSGRELENKVISRTFELKNSVPEDIICDAYRELKAEGLLTPVLT